MPFNAQGLYQRLFNWRTDRDAGTKILAERVDQETDGIVQAINDLIQGNVDLKGPVKNVNGTAANPAITFASDQTSGLFLKGDGSIGVSVSGAEVGALPASFFTGITDHYAATNNPHGVTAAQVGAPTVSEMNAAIAADTTVARSVLTVEDLDTITAEGWYGWSNVWLPNSPVSYGNMLVIKDGSQFSQWVFKGLAPEGVFVRRKTSGVWSSWAQVGVDYEAGTWTPSLNFAGSTTGITYDRRDGHYIKVGSVVHVTGRIYLTSKGSATGNAKISGLPFATGLMTGYLNRPFLITGGGGGNPVWLGMKTDNQAEMALCKLDTGQRVNVTDADFSNGQYISFQITYDTSS